MSTHLERHRLDAVALTFGVLFAVEGVVALAQQAHWVHLHGRTWFGVVVVGVGLAGAAAVVAAALRARNTPGMAPPSR